MVMGRKGYEEHAAGFWSRVGGLTLSPCAASTNAVCYLFCFTGPKNQKRALLLSRVAGCILTTSKGKTARCWAGGERECCVGENDDGSALETIGAAAGTCRCSSGSSLT